MNKLAIAGHTDRGGREHNEDAVDWLLDTDRRWALALVADGMGGYSGGEVASTLALEVFLYHLQPWLPQAKDANTETVAEHLLASARAVQTRLQEEQRKQPELARMGTTLVCGFAWQDQLALLHVGDSRCYRWRAGELSRLTRDHTYLEDVTLGEEAGVSSSKHVLTRALGAKQAFDFSLAVHKTQARDRYVFCSDGVSNVLTAQDWKRCLDAGGENGAVARLLIDTAKRKGADDNVTALVLAVG
ncbi:Stp1/IreP family PP2C-type Ser/Thr phosphatase [Simiduia litorea]|uniref:PP2C family protein-serine/threonine phosphatase n=1 Tax=Simiduia litorea TaxID=1435348 RepID=UPI0036F42F16